MLKRASLDPSKVKKLYINESVCTYYNVSKIRYKKFWNRLKLFSLVTVKDLASRELQVTL